MTLSIVVQNRKSLGDRRGLSRRISVRSEVDDSSKLYEMMCGAIDDFINAKYAEEVLRDIEEIESGNKEIWKEETEAYTFWMTRQGVTFEFHYGENGPEKGGNVTLAQFKLAVQTYLSFLRDPERIPIEVPFPD